MEGERIEGPGGGEKDEAMEGGRMEGGSERRGGGMENQGGTGKGGMVQWREGERIEGPGRNQGGRDAQPRGALAAWGRRLWDVGLPITSESSILAALSRCALIRRARASYKEHAHSALLQHFNHVPLKMHV